MQVRLKYQPEEIAEIETKKTIKTYWKDIMFGQDINLSIFEWQELIVDKYVQVIDDEKGVSGADEQRIYEFVKSIAQLCRSRMTTKLKTISAQLSDIEKEFTE
jgi:hypothetical protein